jgi:hypothetical protein
VIADARCAASCESCLDAFCAPLMLLDSAFNAAWGPLAWVLATGPSWSDKCGVSHLYHAECCPGPNRSRIMGAPFPSHSSSQERLAVRQPLAPLPSGCEVVHRLAALSLTLGADRRLGWCVLPTSRRLQAHRHATVTFTLPCDTVQGQARSRLSQAQISLQ